MVVFIGCGKKKNIVTCEAYKMYQGNYFSACLQYAKTLTSEDNIFILSAKYGVLHLHDIITPYNITLNEATQEQYKEWTQKVLRQLNGLNINSDTEITFLCGKNYYKELLPYFKKVNLPLEQYSGMGYQISFMKKQIYKSRPSLFNI